MEMNASEESSSSSSTHSTAEASKDGKDLSSKDYIAEVLRDACPEMVNSFSDPPISTSDIRYFGSYPYKNHWFDSSPQSLEQLLKMAEQDKEAEIPSVCLIENILPACIAVLGLSWNIDPAFFADHGKLEHNDLPWIRPGSLEGRERIEKSHIHLDGLWTHCEYEGGGQIGRSITISATSVFPRYCYQVDFRVLRTCTRISYCRVHKNLYLFLVESSLTFPNRRGRRTQCDTIDFLLGNQGITTLWHMFSKKDFSILNSVWSVFLSGTAARDIVFSEWSDGVMPGFAMVQMLRSMLWSRELGFISEEVYNFSFYHLRDPCESTNDELLCARRELHDLRSFAEGDLHCMRSVATEIFQHLPHNINPISILERVLQQAEKLERSLMDTFQLFMSSLTVRESRLNIEQARRNAWLTQLASIYLPLSVVTGIFGMNLEEINGGPKLWWAILVLFMLMILTAGIYYTLRVVERKRDERRARRKKATVVIRKRMYESETELSKYHWEEIV